MLGNKGGAFFKAYIISLTVSLAVSLVSLYFFAYKPQMNHYASGSEFAAAGDMENPADSEAAEREAAAEQKESENAETEGTIDRSLDRKDAGNRSSSQSETSKHSEKISRNKAAQKNMKNQNSLMKDKKINRFRGRGRNPFKKGDNRTEKGSTDLLNRAAKGAQKGDADRGRTGDDEKVLPGDEKTEFEEKGAPDASSQEAATEDEAATE